MNQKYQRRFIIVKYYHVRKSAGRDYLTKRYAIKNVNTLLDHAIMIKDDFLTEEEAHQHLIKIVEEKV